MEKKWIIISVIVLLIILGGGVFLLTKPQSSSSDQPQQAGKYKWQRYPDLGRTHVKEGTKITYNSNPPTSGPHYPVWQKYGILDKPVADEYLVHSLEHGYIIFSYNCAKLPKTTTCDQLKQQLTDVTKDKRIWKIIITPRPSLDVPVALTAWTYLDKMETFDKTRAEAFIDQFRDHGPEQTME